MAHKLSGAPAPSGTYSALITPCCMSSRTRACSAGSACSTSDRRRAVSRVMEAMNCIKVSPSQGEVADARNKHENKRIAKNLGVCRAAKMEDRGAGHDHQQAGCGHRCQPGHDPRRCGERQSSCRQHLSQANEPEKWR